MSTEVQVLDEKPGNLVNYDPASARDNVSKINALARYAVRVKDTELMRQAADAKEKEITELVTWWDGCVPEAGGDQKSSAAKVADDFSRADAEEICGFRHQRIAEWRIALREEDFAEKLVDAWMRRAGLIEDPLPEQSDEDEDEKTKKEKEEAYFEEVIMRAIEKRPVGTRLRIRDRLNTKYPTQGIKKVKETKALPKPNYDEDDFTGIVAKPADHRVTKAIEFFFEGVPINKRLWVQQRMEEQETTLKGEGPHIEWVKAYWASAPEVQSAIREGIKLENTKRMEG